MPVQNETFTYRAMKPFLDFCKIGKELSIREQHLLDFRISHRYARVIARSHLPCRTCGDRPSNRCETWLPAELWSGKTTKILLPEFVLLRRAMEDLLPWILTPITSLWRTLVSLQEPPLILAFCRHVWESRNGINHCLSQIISEFCDSEVNVLRCYQ
jgi:hypothetical protein